MSRWLFATQPAGTFCVGTNAIRPNETAGDATTNDELKMCEFAVAPTLIASGDVAGEPAVPSPKKSRSFPAEITGTTPARATFATAGMRASVLGSDCGPPPEKLMMSMPSATAASNAATISAVDPEQQPPSGDGTLKTL